MHSHGYPFQGSQLPSIGRHNSLDKRRLIAPDKSHVNDTQLTQLSVNQLNVIDISGHR